MTKTKELDDNTLNDISGGNTKPWDENYEKHDEKNQIGKVNDIINPNKEPASSEYEYGAPGLEVRDPITNK